eukprot:357212-Chlamydomonas_euryale.AAC.2
MMLAPQQRPVVLRHIHDSNNKDNNSNNNFLNLNVGDRRACDGHVRIALNGALYVPNSIPTVHRSSFTVHPVTVDRSEAGPSPTCRAHTSRLLTHAC